MIITEAGQLQSVTDPGRNASLPNRIRSSSSQVTAGAPLVQTTTPGAEARDALLRKAAREQRLGKMQDLAEPLKSREQAAAPSPANRSLDNEETKMKPPYSARHFRLARNTSSTISSRHPTGIRKHTQIDRFHLATIVEKHVSLSKQGLLQISDRPHPVDRIVDHAVIPGTKIEQSTPSVLEGGAKTVQPFMKTPANIAKTGNSIRDHPSTWDHDSDQLANELAAIALEIENENLSHKSGSWKASEPPRRHSPMIADPDLDMDEDYVYETFVRVPRSELPQDHKDTTTNIGMLVIEEEDEELWQTYAEDEEDSEWDEEDADSNGVSISKYTITKLTFFSGGQSQE